MSRKPLPKLTRECSKVTLEKRSGNRVFNSLKCEISGWNIQENAGNDFYDWFFSSPTVRCRFIDWLIIQLIGCYSIIECCPPPLIPCFCKTPCFKHFSAVPSRNSSQSFVLRNLFKLSSKNPCSVPLRQKWKGCMLNWQSRRNWSELCEATAKDRAIWLPRRGKKKKH